MSNRIDMIITVIQTISITQAQLIQTIDSLYNYDLLWQVVPKVMQSSGIDALSAPDNKETFLDNAYM